MKALWTKILAAVVCFVMVAGMTVVAVGENEITRVVVKIYYLPDNHISDNAAKLAISRDITDYLRMGDISFSLQTTYGNTRDFTIGANEYNREERVITERIIAFVPVGSDRTMEAEYGDTEFLAEDEFLGLVSLTTDIVSGVECSLTNLSIPKDYEFVRSKIEGHTSFVGNMGITIIAYLKPTNDEVINTPPDDPIPGEDPADDSIPSDQPAGWAAERVSRAIGEDIVPEFFQEKYAQPATREEFCSLGVALYEKFNGEILGRREFTDTDNIDVQKMAYIGVVGGTNAEGTLFNPTGNISRAGAATLLTNLANAIGKPLPAGTADFTDNASIPPWALQAVGQVQAAGIMGSTSDNNTFSPNDLYSRQQSIITMLLLYDALL
jgi:hypothetical protein